MSLMIAVLSNQPRTHLSTVIRRLPSQDGMLADIVLRLVDAWFGVYPYEPTPIVRSSFIFE